MIDTLKSIVLSCLESQEHSYHDRRGPMKTLVLSSIFLLFSSLVCPQVRQPLIAVGGISHESNSFNPSKTQLKDFSRRKVAPVEEVLEEWSKSSDIISGYVEGARRFGLKLQPTLVATATPKGIVTDEAFNTLMDELFASSKRSLRSMEFCWIIMGPWLSKAFPTATWSPSADCGKPWVLLSQLW